MRQLPLFPLGLVLYPDERLPLHIFEPRYREMTHYCMDEDRPFGVLLSEEDQIAEVGCTARIEKVLKRHEDGRLDILVRGERRFRVVQVYREKPYLTADVEEIVEPEEPPRSDLRERAITQHMKLLEIAGRTVRPSIYENVSRLSFMLGHNAGMNAQQKQEVLELITENERLRYLVSYFEVLLPRLEEMEGMRRRIQSNGHFKDFPPGELS